MCNKRIAYDISYVWNIHSVWGVSLKSAICATIIPRIINTIFTIVALFMLNFNTSFLLLIVVWLIYAMSSLVTAWEPSNCSATEKTKFSSIFLSESFDVALNFCPLLKLELALANLWTNFALTPSFSTFCSSLNSSSLAIWSTLKVWALKYRLRELRRY